MPPPERISEQDIDRYIAGHRGEPSWKDVDTARHWGLVNVLPYFERQCDSLRASGSPDLYRARELTRFIDKEVRSGGHVNTNKKEISSLLLDRASNKYRTAPKADSREYLEAETEYKSNIADVATYEKQGLIEPVLGMIEQIVAELDYEIDRVGRAPNTDPREEKMNRADIKTLEEKRKLYRRARIFLLDEYFPK